MPAVANNRIILIVIGAIVSHL